MNKNDLEFSLKTNTIVRMIAAPWCHFERWLRSRIYLSSQEAERLRVFHNIHEGQRCIIVGNGPSLSLEDISLISSEITFASNRIYHIFSQTEWRPDYYVAFEPVFVKENIKHITQIECKRARFINSIGKTGTDKKNYWINCTSPYSLIKFTIKNIRFSEDITRCVYDAYSVTYTMLQLAMYMGFKEIVMIGIDHYSNNSGDGSSHFYRDSEKEYRTPTYVEGIEYGYSLANDYARKHGVRIINASRSNGTDIWDRTTLNRVVRGDQNGP